MNEKNPMGNLSIIVPMHNIAGRTENLFSWIFSSYFTHSQIILVHDTSDNQDAKVVHEAIKLNKNIEFVETYCNSPGLARNEGLTRAKRDFIVFWDFDDLPVIEEFIQFYQSFIQSGRTCGAGGYTIRVGGQDTKQITCSVGSLSKNRSELMVNPCLPRWIFKRTLIGKSKFISSKLGEDQYFLATLEVFDQSLLLWEKSVYIYLIGDPNQLTGDKKIGKLSLPVALMILKKYSQVQRYTKDFCFVSASRIALNQIVLKKSFNKTSMELLLMIILYLVRNPKLVLLIPKILSRRNSIR